MSTLHLTLPRTVASPAQARREVSRFAADHDVSTRADVALLVLSELVTNAVLHGAEPIQASVSCDDDALRIEVFDGDRNTSELGPVGARGGGQPGGRGLQIVASLSRSWGITTHDDGKTVWAEVALTRDH
jgi:anti-sigma regulatory factor (Ser/Thr protein kinase)